MGVGDVRTVWSLLPQKTKTGGLSTPIFQRRSISKTISASVSPMPTMRCAPHIMSAENIKPVFHERPVFFPVMGAGDPFATEPVKEFRGGQIQAQYQSCPRPVFLRSTRKFRSRMVGLVRTDTGMSVSFTRRSVMVRVSARHLPLVIMEMQVLVT